MCDATCETRGRLILASYHRFGWCCLVALVCCLFSEWSGQLNWLCWVWMGCCCTTRLWTGSMQSIRTWPWACLRQWWISSWDSGRQLQMIFIKVFLRDFTYLMSGQSKCKTTGCTDSTSHCLTTSVESCLEKLWMDWLSFLVPNTLTTILLLHMVAGLDHESIWLDIDGRLDDCSHGQWALSNYSSSIASSTAVWLFRLDEWPPILCVHVRDLQEIQWVSGYKPKMNAVPQDALTILSEWFNLSIPAYCHMIIAWMEENIQNHLTAKDWWSIRGQDWAYYKMVLNANCTPDGLEFWSASRASGFHFNLVQRGQIWTSRRAGLDRDDFTLMMLENRFIYCDQVDAGRVSSTDRHGSKGLPLSGDSPHSQPLDLSFSREDLPRTRSQTKAMCSCTSKPQTRQTTRERNKTDSVSRAKGANVKDGSSNVKSARKSSQKPLSCFECGFRGKRARDLYWHMKASHPLGWPYQCADCGLWFNTEHDRCVHSNSVHAQEVLSCSMCSFTTYNKFCLMNHEHTHSNKKLQCDHCDVSLSSVSALREHQARHFDKCIHVRHVKSHLPLHCLNAFMSLASLAQGLYAWNANSGSIRPFNWLRTKMVWKRSNQISLVPSKRFRDISGTHVVTMFRLEVFYCLLPRTFLLSQLEIFQSIFLALICADISYLHAFDFAAMVDICTLPFELTLMCCLLITLLEHFSIILAKKNIFGMFFEHLLCSSRLLGVVFPWTLRYFYSYNIRCRPFFLSSFNFIFHCTIWWQCEFRDFVKLRRSTYFLCMFRK